MELAVPLLIVLSAGAGFVLRNRVSRAASGVLLGLGLGSLILGVAILWLTVVGWMPLGSWTAGLTAVVLLGLAVFVLPFSLVVRCCGQSATTG